MKRGYTCGKNVDFVTQAIKPLIIVGMCTTEGTKEVFSCVIDSALPLRRAKRYCVLPRQEQPTAVSVVLIMASYL